jgi:hypothetical protein
VFYTLLADRFGIASYGTVRGLAAPVTTMLSAVCVRFAGEVFDRTGGYELMFSCFVGLMLVAAVVIFATRFTKAAAFAASKGTAASA